MRRSALVVTAALALSAGGCATGGGGDRPSLHRPAVAVQDEVTTIDRAKLVGSWSCREMNPIEGHPATTSTVTFNKDGTGHNTGTVDMAAQGTPIPGKMNVDVTYDWQAAGDRVTSSNVKSTVSAADGNAATGMVAGIAQFAINSFSGGAKPGTLDVLRLTQRELILRNVDVADGPVLDCTRS